MKKKIVFAWSGGRDSSFALWRLLQSGDVEVRALLTTVTDAYNRISMHGVRVELLEEQAFSIGLPLEKVLITPRSSNEEYEERMKEALLRYKAEEVEAVGFGDIFLEDLKRYREEKLAAVGMAALFPLWKEDTRQLSRRFIREGFRAVLTCVDTNVLAAGFSGAEYDDELLGKLPPSVDPCGENGEFHSFVYEGPMFRTPIRFVRGERVLRDGRFCFRDLVPHSCPLKAQ